MFKRLAFVTTMFLTGPQIAQATDTSLPLCPGSARMLSADRLLRSAVAAAYPGADERPNGRRRKPGDPCLFPYQALRYGDTVVLITLAQAPGEACHGCPAQVSAVFLRQAGKSLAPTGRHDAFLEAGTFGDLVSVRPVRLGRSAGLVIESGGMFQGYSSTAIDPFLIQDGRMTAIGPAGGIPMGDSNCGVHDEGEPCRDVSGQWRAEGERLIVRYSGTRDDGSRVDETVVYELREGTLVLVSGAEIAAEMIENRP